MQNLFSGASSSSSTNGSSQSIRIQKWQLGVGIIVLLIGLVWSSRQTWFPLQIGLKQESGQTTSSSGANKESEEMESAYSAIYLSNSQVYFGKIKTGRGSYLELTDVFYFRQRAEPHEGNIRLIKLGNELHGPEDRVHFNRDQVILVEKMKEDSEIVKAIMRFKNE